MKRYGLLSCVLVLCLGVAPISFAQMGMDLFKKPTIAKVFNPVVGKGAMYESTSKSSDKTRTMEISVVGKDVVDGKEAFWMQFYTQEDKGTMAGKSLITKDDFEFHRMIIQPPGQQAMEMPFNPTQAHENKMKENLSDWHSIGTETITVPAGTFACEHWHNDKTNGDVWTSDKVTPFGMVKEVGATSGMVLVKVLTDVPDRITGPVKKFDMQQMMQQMQQQRQQQQQQPKQ
jgi:hypothetical protein